MEKAADFKKMEWNAVSTAHLIELWEENIEGLRGVRKNSHIYKEIADKLGVTATEVKNKIENLTKKYKKEQTLVGPSGGAPSTWEYYEKIHQILATSKAINYKRVMVESTDLTRVQRSTSNDQDSPEDSCIEASTSTAKRKKADKMDRLLEIEEKKLEAINAMMEERKSFHKKILEAIEKTNNN